MPEKIPFIGRQDEIALIENLIEESGTRRVLSIHGPGGIGKTRLLQEVRLLYTGNQNITLLVTDILDFDDRAFQVPANLERQIAQRLNENTFEPYLRELLDWRKMESVGVSKQGLEKQSKRVHRMFIDNFNKLSKKHRIILLLDTTEKLEEEIWERLISLMEAAQNTIFLLAGRNAKELWTKLRNSPIGSDALLIDLPPFTEEIGQQYLEQKERSLYITLDADLKQKLLLLSGGRPILLELAVEWLTRELPRDWMTQKSYEELLSLPQEQLTEYQADFEEQLVRHITRLRGSIERLTLVMSWIYPLTPAMIVKLLNVSKDEAKLLFDEAQTYIFVKLLPDKRITLHDEMRRLVNENVWPEIDPQGGRRRQYSKIAAELFKVESNQLKEKLTDPSSSDLGGLFERERLARKREVVNQQWIEHALYSDAESGFDVWKRIIDECRREKEFRFAKSLLEIARPYYKQFHSDQKFEFSLRQAQLKNDHGQAIKAEQMLHKLLGNNKGKKERESKIYNALALAEERLGKLREARDHQLECLNIVTEIDQDAIPLVATRVGYIHRLLGELPEAEKYYKIALNSVIIVNGTRSKNNMVATILNNLGYVYGLQGNHDEMRFYCYEARKIWIKIGAESEIGKAETTIAIFLREIGRYDEAIELLERAIGRYKEPDDHEKICRAYFSLGWTQWYKAQKADEKVSDIRQLNWDKELLNQARDSTEKSKELAENYGLKWISPGILHLGALVYWYLGRIQQEKSLCIKGRALNTESYNKSKLFGDTRYAISNLLANAEWDYEIANYDRISAYAQKLDSEYKDQKHIYPLYFGRMRRIEADIAFAKGDFQTAFSKYALGLALINQHGGFGKYTTQRELGRLGNKIEENLAPKQMEHFVEFLRQQWIDIKNKDSRFLITWCKQQLLRAKLRSIEW